MMPAISPMTINVLTVLSKVKGFENGVFITKNEIKLVRLVKFFYTFTRLFANIQSFS